MNALYECGTYELVEENKTEIELLQDEIEKLKYENEALSIRSDDVQSLLSKEICQLKCKIEWCQSQSLGFELQLQNNVNSSSF